MTRLADEGGLVAPTGPAGSVIMFHGNIVHASAYVMHRDHVAQVEWEAYEASGVQPPTFDGRFKWPQPRLS